METQKQETTNPLRRRPKVCHVRPETGEPEPVKPSYPAKLRVRENGKPLVGRLPRRKIREEFPWSLANATVPGRERRWLRRNLAKYPPDYTSRLGRPRWKVKPVLPPMELYGIVGTNAASLAVAWISPRTRKARYRFVGTHAHCEKLLAWAVARWMSLPMGREIEQAAMELAKAGEVVGCKLD